ncbi:MAG: chromosome segregation protein SMC, partial [Leptolyngbyaceae bacterium]|nr:chromosome segregation protein SMC [Leptolyngbyaceae bacterium]
MYVKRVELSNFKSFGGTTPVPLLPGFTVISGPNGSGKSNILDALLFALGLSSSKGMRADRLPDLVNHAQATRGRSTVEASVTVTFELGDTETEFLDATDLPSTEWVVTRKLRVTQQGTYTSNYYINGEPCTLTELHEQLNQLRIYPEGYNVVLQGDVTSIISMNPRERREIIDELAGVAAFDRKIVQAKEKLDAVKEREDRFRIVEKELVDQRDRLSQDRVKAEKYQKLRAELEAKSRWEGVINYQRLAASVQRLGAQIDADERSIVELTEQLNNLGTEIQRAEGELETLNRQVRALGEEEHLALQATLATREAELRQLQRQEQDLAKATEDTANRIRQIQQEIQAHLKSLDTLAQEEQSITAQDLSLLRQQRDEAQQAVEQSREAVSVLAAASEAWVQQQTSLHHQIETLVQTLDPQRTQQAQLQERVHQLERQTQEQVRLLETLSQEIAGKEANTTQTTEVQTTTTAQVQAIAQSLATLEQNLQIQQETQTRLLQEQREKQRRLDKLEAEAQAVQETQGTFSTRLILQSGMPGICGLVAQLGRVESRYQLALETAAGARLGNLVVEDDGIAAAGIALLKQKKAGRATFLPLNKIQAPRLNAFSNWQKPEGLIDYAVNLLDCESRYRNIFGYVFGNTVVFATLDQARRHLGEYRIVTVEGELLEASGAMTGGSVDTRYSIHFGTGAAQESAEVTSLRSRLQEIEQILVRCTSEISCLLGRVKERSQELIEARQQHRESQMQAERLQADLKSLTNQRIQLETQQVKTAQEFTDAIARLQVLSVEIPAQSAQLQALRQSLAELEQSQTHSEWQQLQATVRTQETLLQEKELALRSANQRLQELEIQRQRLQEKVQLGQSQLQQYRSQQTDQLNQSATFSSQRLTLSEQITQTQTALAELEKTLGIAKETRDRAERQLRDQRTQQQQFEWQRQKTQETQQTRRQELAELQTQLQAQYAELPDPLP